MEVKSNKKLLIWIWLVMAFMFLIVLFTGLYRGSVNEKAYLLAEGYINSEQYSEAESILANLDFKDSDSLMEEARTGLIYQAVLDSLAKAAYEEIPEKLKEAEEFEDSEKTLKLKEEIKEVLYLTATEKFKQGEYDVARQLFQVLNGYEDSDRYLADIDGQLTKLTEKTYQTACNLMKEGKHRSAIENFNLISGYRDSAEKAETAEIRWRQDLSHTISAGIYNVFAVSTDNKVLSAGYSFFKQCEVGAWEKIVSVDGYGECTLGLTEDGHVQVAGNIKEMDLDKIKSWEHVVDIAAGQNFIAVLKSDGTVDADGHKANGRCAVDSWQNVIDIDAGWGFVVGLTEDGELLFTGTVSHEITDSYANTRDEWKDVIKIAASGGDTDEKKRGNRGKGHIVGLKNDGSIVAIGDNSQGQCTFDREEWKGLVTVAAGDWYTVGLTENGKILMTGENKPKRKYLDLEKIAEWEKEKIVDIAAGYGHTLVLKDTGEVDAIWFDTEDKLSEDVGNWKTKIMR